MDEVNEIRVPIEEEIIDQCVSLGRAMELIWNNPRFDVKSEIDYKAADITMQHLSFQLHDLWLTWNYAEKASLGAAEKGES